jgi:hypothetical protein
MISTILLIANLIALIFTGAALFSFWLNALFYVIEAFIYIIIFVSWLKKLK